MATCKPMYNKYNRKMIFSTSCKSEYDLNRDVSVIDGIIKRDDLATLLSIDNINECNMKIAAYLNFPQPTIIADDRLTLGQYMYCWERICWNRIINRKFSRGCTDIRIQATCYNAINETIRYVKLKIMTFYLMKKV